MIFRDDCLDGKRILVTGGSSGIGKDAAEMMAAAGARLVIVGRDKERLEATLGALSGLGHRAEVIDLSSLDGAHDFLVSLTKETGPIDGLFHSAGEAAIRLARMINADHYRSVFGAAFDAGLGFAKACAKKNVLNDGGAIVYMTSVAGVRGKAGMVAYSGAKAAIGGLTRSLAAELAPRRIRVNEIVAGAVETPMHANIAKNMGEASLTEYREMHPLGFGKPRDVSAMVTFLMTDASRWITGAALPVDGGYLAI